MKVKAAVAHKAGAPLTIETVKLDGPRAGEALVEIKATGKLRCSNYIATTRQYFSFFY